MRTVTAMDLRKGLGEILGAASAGERILIERDHKPLAYLVSVEEGERRDPDVEATVSRDSLRWIDWSASERRCGRFPPPDDSLTEVEWRHQEIERRIKQIDRAASSRGEDG